MNSKTSKSSNSESLLVDYAALFRLLPEPYIIIRANNPEFTFLDVNEAHCKMTGVPRDKIIGRSFFEVFPDVSEEYKRTGVSNMRQTLEQVIHTKHEETLESFRYDIAGPDGNFIEKHWQPSHYPILDMSGNVAFIVQSSHDVTDELAAARKLRETQVQLHDALNIGKVGSWLWDVDKDKVIANETLADLFGVEKEVAITGMPIKTFTDAIHHEDRTRVLDEINESIKRGRNFESEYRVVSTTGSVAWVLARGRLEISANGHTAKFPGVIMDITERHDFEAQIEEARLRDQVNRQSAELLKKRNEELEALARTKDEFVALASHQLRTPATAVKQYVGMVIQGYVGDVTETQMDMLDKAFQSNERQIQIINQILNAARVDTGRLVMTPAPLDVRAQLEGIVEEMRPTVEAKGHTLEVEIGKTPVKILADASYLRMALENVIHNASIYTPAPGHIRIQLKKTAKQVEISISDDGVGIKQADISKLFTKFSRIHNPLSVQAGGSGIGLYLTAEILRLHDGDVQVTSKIHKGTTFTIHLPLLRRGQEGPSSILSNNRRP